MPQIGKTERIVQFGEVPVLSANGRYLAFSYAFGGLVPNDPEGEGTDVFVIDCSNRLVGGNDNDTLSGLGGNDSLLGGAGDDVLRGGAGRDQFIYRRLSDRQDQILDFKPGKDKIVLQSLLDQVARKGYRGKNAIADGYVRLKTVGSSTRIEIDANGKRPGENTPLVTVEDMASAGLKQASNFVF